MLPDLKKQDPWLCDVSSVPLQQSLRHPDKAFKNFFEGRANYPTFKKKQNSQSATYATNAFKWERKHLTLAKMDAPLDIHWHRSLPKDAQPSSLTITKDCANRYFVSILVEEDIKSLPLVHSMVGLDLGLLSMVILSTGEAVGNINTNEPPNNYQSADHHQAEEEKPNEIMRKYPGNYSHSCSYGATGNH